MAFSSVEFWSFITELVVRNPNLGIPALEDGLFASRVLPLIFGNLLDFGIWC